MAAAYTELCDHMRQIGHLASITRLAGWDQETYMPERGGAARSDQQAILAGLVHERRTHPHIGELIAACESDAGLMADSATAANVREMRRDYDKATKLPKDLVAELAKVGSQAQEAWKKAREKSDFKAFLPWLEQMISLTRRKAECLSKPGAAEAYDALIDLYEPDTTAAQIESTFTPLRAELTTLIQEVRASKVKVNTKCLQAKIPAEAQHKFGLAVLEAMGFDLKAGRLDTTTHPFCEGLSPGDTRLTTRYRDEKFTDALYGTMHEGGHGIYEQGLPKLDKDGNVSRLYGTPLTDSISLGIHESQSRMWENFVGRSKPFIKWALPKSKKYFGKALAKWDVKDLYAAVNTTQPSLIRVEADEGTYNLHVMVRFELERALIGGSMKVKDLPGEWNKRYEEYLGIDVPDDKRGCLQDVHWSFGLFGYFPTYTLGNLYAAQFWEKINQDIPDLAKDIGKGKMHELKVWLNEKIHVHGRRYAAGELCQKITGKPLSAEPLLRHLRKKAEQVYGI